MSAGIVIDEPKRRSLLERATTLLLGAPLPDRVPDRVYGTIQKEQDQSEILVSVIQMIAIGSFAVLYALTPKGFGADVAFEPVPFTLAVYALFTLVRLWLALQKRLPRWFIATSIVVDIAVLLVTIWSFHLQYEAPPALYLKAPTLMYVFILIALRTLRFEPAMVILTGVAAGVGWLALVIYAVAHEQTCSSMEFMEVLAGAEGCGITRMFSDYTT
ncbi:MAG: adenylate/guanylate cyclase domain-containing protein, partial [Geminicoccaceae bacterium]